MRHRLALGDTESSCVLSTSLQPAALPMGKALARSLQEVTVALATAIKHQNVRKNKFGFLFVLFGWTGFCSDVIDSLSLPASPWSFLHLWSMACNYFKHNAKSHVSFSYRSFIWIKHGRPEGMQHAFLFLLVDWKENYKEKKGGERKKKERKNFENLWKYKGRSQILKPHRRPNFPGTREVTLSKQNPNPAWKCDEE